MKVAFVGPDMTGKSNIATALSKDIGVPMFKNTNEWTTDLKSPEYFLNLLRYGGPFLMDFIGQTNVSVILDRYYPCEYVYSIAMGRDTDIETIRYLDKKFSVNTISFGGLSDNYMKKNFKQNYSKYTLKKRMLKLEDVIPAIDYLISSEYITGQNIIVDGGWSVY